jgi:PhnB protein
MTQIHVYLTFNGNCREAMTFYQECLGGEFMLQTIGGSPLAEQMPPKMKDCILHATLTNGNLILLGSDMVSNAGLIKGNAVSLSLMCSSEKEIRDCYENYRQTDKPRTLWSILFGARYLAA